ncbi:hypothetical protein BT96DRAFT_946160 [Gymnopus androsaceus JB14]|uniref:Uncharacterized protein n=1 Tax=Gymnopus androsaceus JB14 TaxID=1447944 RepID=A0A6A4GX63_9AGAR|nr:hypothetical protein BT96DRAFT_946160 [Gymnopus androsaceus JB14]
MTPKSKATETWEISYIRWAKRVEAPVFWRYQVHWKGWPDSDDTLERASNLVAAQGSLNDFWAHTMDTIMASTTKQSARSWTEFGIDGETYHRNLKKRTLEVDSERQPRDWYQNLNCVLCGADKVGICNLLPSCTCREVGYCDPCGARYKEHQGTLLSGGELKYERRKERQAAKLIKNRRRRLKKALGNEKKSSPGC